MSKPGSSQTHVAPVSDATRSTAAVLERQHTLGSHVCVQREASSPAVDPDAPALVREVIGSSGQPLDQASRASLEPHFGFDFSQVRVHTGDKAAASAAAMRAQAFTAGSNVVFGAGHYSPGTPHGQELLAHELTHVVQQSRGPVSGTALGAGLSVSHPADRFEQEARHTAAAVSDDRIASARVDQPLAPLPRRESGSAATFVQREDSDLSSTESHLAAGANVLSGLSAAVGLIAAFDSAKSAKRQAVAGERQAQAAEEQTAESKQQTEIARQALAVAENPPVPPPLAGGIVVNGGQPYSDIPSVPAPKASIAPRGESSEKPFTLLRVSQGGESYASFKAFIKTDGREITGGYLQDGDAGGYVGGSAAGNLNVTLRPMAGPPAPFVTPKGKPTVVSSVKFLIGGNNIAPRTKAGTLIQRFSGAVTLTAAGEAIISKPFNVSPGTSTTVATPSEATPAVSIDLPVSSPAPSGDRKPDPVPAKKLDGGAPPK